MSLETMFIPALIAIISLDTTHVLQSNISKPIIGCVIIGAILGDIHLGLLMGVVFQPIWLAMVPVGGTFFPEGEIATMYFLWLLEISLQSGYSLASLFFPTVILIIIFALMGGLITTMNRKINARLILFNETKEKFINPAIYLSIGIITHIILWTLILILLRLPLLSLMNIMADIKILVLPVKWTMASVLALGIAQLINLRKVQKYKMEVLIGAVLGGIGIWLI